MSGLKQTFITRLTDYDTIAKEVLGTLRFEVNKIYKYVDIFNSTNTVASHATLGTLVGYHKNADNGYLNNQVSIDVAVDSDALPLPAGALVALGVPGVAATHYYGWLLIKGQTTLDTAITNAAIASGIYLSAVDKTGVVITAPITQPCLGVCVNTTTSIQLNCPQ